MGVPIAHVTMEETLAYARAWLSQPTPQQIATVNPEFLVRARQDPAFRSVLQRAALCIPDGIGVLWAARWRGSPLAERVAGVDLVERLSAEAAHHGWRVFFLGAAPGVAEAAAQVLSQRYPHLIVAGCYAGSPAPAEEAAIVEKICAAHTDILFVAYGAPAQDLWLDRNLARTGARLGLGIGGAFDFIAGVAQRAPRWIQRLGLEWLHRLIKQPWRWRRQLALPQFVLLILSYRDAPPPS